MLAALVLPGPPTGGEATPDAVAAQIFHERLMTALTVAGAVASVAGGVYLYRRLHRR